MRFVVGTPAGSNEDQSKTSIEDTSSFLRLSSLAKLVHYSSATARVDVGGTKAVKLCSYLADCVSVIR